MNSVNTPAEGQLGATRRWMLTLLPEVLLLGVCVVFWVQTYAFEQEGAQGLGPTFLPRLLLVLLALCVLGRVAQKFSAARSSSPKAGSTAQEEETAGLLHVEEGAIPEEDWPSSTPHLLLGVGLAAGYALATTYLGYPLATLLLLVGFVSLASRFTWLTLAVALGVALSFPYLFVKVVYIDLPRGVGVFDDFTVWLYGLLGIY